MQEDAEVWARHFLYGNGEWRDGYAEQLKAEIKQLKKKGDQSPEEAERLTQLQDLQTDFAGLKTQYDQDHLRYVLELARLPVFQAVPELMAAARHHVAQAIPLDASKGTAFGSIYEEYGFSQNELQAARQNLHTQIITIFDRLDAFINGERREGAPEQGLLGRALVYLATSVQHASESTHPQVLQKLLDSGVFEHVATALYGAETADLDTALDDAQIDRLSTQIYWAGLHDGSDADPDRNTTHRLLQQFSADAENPWRDGTADYQAADEFAKTAKSVAEKPNYRSLVTAELLHHMAALGDALPALDMANPEPDKSIIDKVLEELMSNIALTTKQPTA